VRYTINRKTKSYTICVSFSVSARNTQRNTFCAFKKATERYTLSVSSSISKDILLLYSIETLVKKNKTYIFFGISWGYTLLCLQWTPERGNCSTPSWSSVTIKMSTPPWNRPCSTSWWGMNWKISPWHLMGQMPQLWNNEWKPSTKQETRLLQHTN